LRPLYQLHLLVIVFASTTILGRLISLSATATIIWRTLLAALGAAVMVWCFQRRSARVSRGQMLGLLGIGGIVGLHWVCLFGAIKVANISIALTGLATISLFTAFTAPLLEKRPIRGLEVALGLLVLSGLALIAGFERGHWVGLGLALLSAFLAAVFPVLNRKIVNGENELGPMAMVAWEMLGACLTLLLLLPLLTGETNDPAKAYATLLELRGLDWLWLLILAFVCTVFAHAFHIHLLRHLSAFTSNLAINFEPVWGIAAAALIFGEHKQLHPGFYAGTLTIVVANVLHAAIPAWKKRRKSC
jgi:drug/metabolite transporter (DMT)-like permease